eukprot:1289742-Amphidinium_carterae.1
MMWTKEIKSLGSGRANSQFFDSTVYDGMMRPGVSRMCSHVLQARSEVGCAMSIACDPQGKPEPSTDVAPLRAHLL